MTDDEFVANVVAACRRLPNMVAVTLGGFPRSGRPPPR